MTDTGEMQVYEGGALESLIRGEVDMQVATAKKYPRSMSRFSKQALSLATMDPAVAEGCYFSVPRGGKKIEGPSVRLAEICAGAYGNLRCGARIVAEDDKTVTAQGIAWDMESNVMVTKEVRRKITDRNGRRYSDDMIIMTGNAACSIAFRNALFSIVPRVSVDRIMGECKKVAAGQGVAFEQRRTKAIEWFKTNAIGSDDVALLIGRDRAEDMDGDDLASLLGMATAVKEGTTTVEEIKRQVSAAKKESKKDSSFGFGDDPKKKKVA